MALKQDNRMLRVKTPLGENVVVASGFRGHEEISRLFHYELDLISDNNSISASQIVGKNVTLSIELADGSFRHFNGFVSRFYAGDEDREGRRGYRAEVVPWLWFLTRTTDCRIFQDKTAQEIIEQIFGDLGFSDYDVAQIKGQHPKREYCVQYGETDFAFVSRLMEQEGIFYFFRHEDGKHTLVLADQKGAYQDCDESEVDYPRDVGTRAVTDHVKSWEHRYEFRSGKWAQTDYNFEDHPARNETTPSKLLMTNENSTVPLDGIDKYELYDYPGGYKTKGDGAAYTKTRMEEEEVEHDVVYASSNCKTFTTGGKFKMNSHRCGSEEGKSYAITAVDHEAQEPWAYETGTPVEGDYSNTFTCIPDSVTFRPARITPKPVVQGVQTAVVTGPSGEEIWPDKYGRVKVQFFWDREGTRDENTSCWIRVSQAYAGKNWGSMCIPRIGQEVVVSFVEGDPDRPIITGRVYNADQTPPYSLPGEKLVSGIKSDSSPNGGGYNEIILDDTADEELIRIHAQYDMDTTVENDLREHVLNDRTRDVANNESISVGVDQTIDVGANQKTSVGADQQLDVGANQAVSVGANQSITVGASHSLTAKDAVEIKANTTITLKAGGSTIEIGPSGIKISSTGKIKIEGTMVDVTGYAVTKILGSLVKIN